MIFKCNNEVKKGSTWIDITPYGEILVNGLRPGLFVVCYNDEGNPVEGKPCSGNSVLLDSIQVKQLATSIEIWDEQFDTFFKGEIKR